jgi:SPP1 family predicted phage head-tail adaptor
MSMSVIQQGYSPVLMPGRMRHFIKILVPTLQQDTTGGTQVTQDAVVAKTWASIEALTATEKFAAHEFISEVSHKIVIRWRRGITAKMRILMSSNQRKRLFLVEGILNPDERNKSLTLMCIELFDGADTAMGI